MHGDVYLLFVSFGMIYKANLLNDKDALLVIPWHIVRYAVLRPFSPNW